VLGCTGPDRVWGIGMRLRRVLLALTVAAMAPAACVFCDFARADIVISIDKSAQQMTVTVDGDPRYIWPVSTGQAGYDTPAGDFKPFRMERAHFSSEWDDAPMPHSIFFTQNGHAIHGSNYVNRIGTPASHGCVRLEPANAAILFGLVKQHKMVNTRVELTGDAPGVAGVPMARRNRSYQREARGWREIQDDSRSYYYRDRPYVPQRRYGGPYLLPFGW